MAEKHFVYLKNNIVEQIAVFASQDEELADRIAQEQGYDDAIWVGEDKPVMFSSYDGTSFTPPTNEYLISIGILNPTPVEEPVSE